MKRVSYLTAMLCGTWTAAKMPQINGNYSGNVLSNSNRSQAIPVTATITADANFNITGHASVSSLCFNQLTLSGLQVGGAGEFVGTDPQRRFGYVLVHLEGRHVRKYSRRLLG